MYFYTNKLIKTIETYLIGNKIVIVDYTQTRLVSLRRLTVLTTHEICAAAETMRTREDMRRLVPHVISRDFE